MTLDALHEFAVGWTEWAGAVLMDGGIVLVVAVLLWLPVRRRASAQLGYVLFVVVLVRLALPIELPTPDWLSALRPSNWVSTWIEADAVPLTAFAVAGPPSPAPAAVPTAVSEVFIPWQTWVFGAWLGISALLAGLNLRKRARTAAVVRRSRPVRPGELELDFEALCRTAGLRRPVRLLITDEIETPAAGGVWSPYVLMPSGLLPQLQARPLRWVLLHELVHIRRGDLPVAMLQDCAAILMFFHPAVWITNWLCDEQREFACDEAAWAASGVSRHACGDGFLSVVEWAQRHRGGADAALAMFRPNNVIRKRLMRILQDRPKGRRHVAFNLVFAAAAALLLMPSARATPGAQDPEKIRRLERALEQLEKQQAELRSVLRSLKSEAGATSGGGRVIREKDPERKVRRRITVNGREIDVDEMEMGGVIELDGGKTLRFGKGGKGLTLQGGGVLKVETEVEAEAEVEVEDQDVIISRPLRRRFRTGGVGGRVFEVEVDDDDDDDDDDTGAVRGRGKSGVIVHRRGDGASEQVEVRALVRGKDGKPVTVRRLFEGTGGGGKNSAQGKARAMPKKLFLDTGDAHHVIRFEQEEEGEAGKTGVHTYRIDESGHPVRLKGRVLETGGGSGVIHSIELDEEEVDLLIRKHGGVGGVRIEKPRSEKDKKDKKKKAKSSRRSLML